MKMIAGVVLRSEAKRILRVADRLIKIGEAIERMAGANPFIHGSANRFSIRRIIAAALIWSKGRPEYEKPMLMGLLGDLRDSSFQALGEIAVRLMVAHIAADIVDAFEHDDIAHAAAGKDVPVDT